MKANLNRILSSLVFITGFAFALRMLTCYVLSRMSLNPVKTGLPYGFELGNVASAIAAGKGFSDPIRGLDSGATVWFTPIYPYLVAGIFKLWGIYSDLSHFVIQAMNSAFGSLTIIPIYGIAKKTFGEGVALGAAWVWVFLPTALYYPVVWVWDTTLIALIFSLIFWATLELRGKIDIFAWIGYGALWAVGVLINPSILSLFPFFLGWLVWEARKVETMWAKPLAAALLIFAICMVPWTVRNYRVFGKVIVLRSNFGLELWLGNNPKMTGTMGAWQHPTTNQEQSEKYRRMGEIAYMAEKKQEAISYMRSNPAETLDRIFRRFEITWLVFSDSPVDVWNNGDLEARSFLISICLTSVLCLLGALFASRARHPEAFLYAIVLLVFPLIFYVTHSDGRYRFPIEPIILILAVSAVAHLFSLAKYRNPNPKNAAAPGPSVPAL